MVNGRIRSGKNVKQFHASGFTVESQAYNLFGSVRGALLTTVAIPSILHWLYSKEKKNWRLKFSWNWNKNKSEYRSGLRKEKKKKKKISIWLECLCILRTSKKIEIRRKIDLDMSYDVQTLNNRECKLKSSQIQDKYCNKDGRWLNEGLLIF